MVAWAGESFPRRADGSTASSSLTSAHAQAMRELDDLADRATKRRTA
ncbi:hypothetical protein AB0F05_15635 [Streptomyces microflavus]|uniref:Uncharacterized protein n=1 Tax=Streptomyces microflavus TaxID=1919 RepID=A0A7H8MGT3_STRMI|nr:MULTISPECIES: hypothetical protein [Streptomyces]MBK3585882.1 hypothetical protein [Streptomyces sp. MBT57]MEE1730056.1 hypothetical protein [Streptomyces sp. BE282]QKW41054.1 hypothetical protein HUT09_09480 [Streptomyces microflavus]QTA31758.1 hypothetical protein JHY03_18940 [Streptomyces sp. CA-256286]